MERKRGVQIKEGDRINRWTVIKEVESKSGSSNFEDKRFLCRCDCGTERILRYKSLAYKTSKSCGCYMREFNSKNRRKFPQDTVKSRIYTIWNGIKCRCYTKSSISYKRYGEKGITMCDEWRNDFMTFYNWAMANGYSDDLTIDRIDYRGNYEPSNCRWATSKTQANNKSNVRRYSFNGESHTIPEWSELTGIDSTVIWARLCTLGWSIERTLTTPVRFIDETRTEADMEIINRSLITAAKEHKCGCCDGVISVGEKYSLLHVSKDYKIVSIRLHLACENTYVDSVKNYCRNSIEKRWNKMKSVSNKAQKGEEV